MQEPGGEARVLFDDGSDIGDVSGGRIEHAGEFDPGAGEDRERAGFENHTADSLVVQEIIAVGEVLEEGADHLKTEGFAEESMGYIEGFSSFKFI